MEINDVINNYHNNSEEVQRCFGLYNGENALQRKSLIRTEMYGKGGQGFRPTRFCRGLMRTSNPNAISHNHHELKNKVKK